MWIIVNEMRPDSEIRLLSSSHQVLSHVYCLMKHGRGGSTLDRRLNIYVRLNINTLSHKHFIIGVLFYNSDRRWQADMCEVYKYVHNMYKSNPFFSHTQSHYQLRGHSLKLEKNFCRTTLRQHFFSNKVVNDWNRLPEDVVSASSLQSFKRKLRSLPSGEEG